MKRQAVVAVILSLLCATYGFYQSIPAYSKRDFMFPSLIMDALHIPVAYLKVDDDDNPVFHTKGSKLVSPSNCIPPSTLKDKDRFLISVPIIHSFLLLYHQGIFPTNIHHSICIYQSNKKLKFFFHHVTWKKFIIHQNGRVQSRHNNINTPIVHIYDTIILLFRPEFINYIALPFCYEKRTMKLLKHDEYPSLLPPNDPKLESRQSTPLHPFFLLQEVLEHLLSEDIPIPKLLLYWVDLNYFRSIYHLSPHPLSLPSSILSSLFTKPSLFLQISAYYNSPPPQSSLPPHSSPSLSSPPDSTSPVSSPPDSNSPVSSFHDSTSPISSSPDSASPISSSPLSSDTSDPHLPPLLSFPLPLPKPKVPSSAKSLLLAPKFQNKKLSGRKVLLQNHFNEIHKGHWKRHNHTDSSYFSPQMAHPKLTRTKFHTLPSFSLLHKKPSSLLHYSRQYLSLTQALSPLCEEFDDFSLPPFLDFLCHSNPSNRELDPLLFSPLLLYPNYSQWLYSLLHGPDSSSSLSHHAPGPLKLTTLQLFHQTFQSLSDFTDDDHILLLSQTTLARMASIFLQYFAAMEPKSTPKDETFQRIELTHALANGRSQMVDYEDDYIVIQRDRQLFYYDTNLLDKTFKALQFSRFSFLQFYQSGTHKEGWKRVSRELGREEVEKEVRRYGEFVREGYEEVWKRRERVTEELRDEGRVAMRRKEAVERTKRLLDELDVRSWETMVLLDVLLFEDLRGGNILQERCASFRRSGVWPELGDVLVNLEDWLEQRKESRERREGRGGEERRGGEETVRVMLAERIKLSCEPFSRNAILMAGFGTTLLTLQSYVVTQMKSFEGRFNYYTKVFLLVMRKETVDRIEASLGEMKRPRMKLKQEGEVDRETDLWHLSYLAHINLMDHFSFSHQLTLVRNSTP